MKRSRLLFVACLSLATAPGYAADHVDGPEASSTPSADIADYFAWMSSDARTLNMVLTVAPFASEGAMFSDALVYAFHVGSSQMYGGAEQTTDILCVFPGGSQIECWVGEGADYLTGDASDPAGVTSEDGTLRAFAGLRNDPFFFEFAGFNETVAAVVAAAPSLTFDAHGCPGVDPDTSAALVRQLQSGPDGAPASNALEQGNVLAIVLSLDVESVNQGGPLLSTWSSTHVWNP